MNEQKWRQLYLILFILSSPPKSPPTSLVASATARVRRPLVRAGGSGLIILRNGPINFLLQFQVMSFPKGDNDLLNKPLHILRCFCLEIFPRIREEPVQYPSALCYRPHYRLFHLPVLLRGHGGYRLLRGPQSLPVGLITRHH